MSMTSSARNVRRREVEDITSPASFAFIVNELPVNDQLQVRERGSQVSDSGFWAPPIQRNTSCPQPPGRIFRWADGSISPSSEEGFGSCSFSGDSYDSLSATSNESNWGPKVLSHGWEPKLPRCSNSISYGSENSCVVEESPNELQTCQSTTYKPQNRNNCFVSSRDCQRSNVLTVDGGGTRGYYSSLILKDLTERIRRLEEASGHPTVVPCEMFDLIAETSTGGALASALSRLSRLVDNRALDISSSSIPETVKHDRPPWSQHLPDFAYLKGNVPNCNTTQIGPRSRWILGCREFQNWRDRPDGCFWLSGSPGTGKSTLMSMIARHLKIDPRKGEQIVVYSVDANIKAVNHATMILGEMIVELLIRERPEDALQDLESVFMDLILSKTRLSISRMKYVLSRIRHNLRSHESLCVLIDGLGETGHDNEEQHLLYELVDHLTRYDPNHHIKCLISSRPTLGQSFRSDFQVCLDSHPSSREILALYIHEGVQKCILNHNTRAAEMLTNSIINEADGVFLWARLVFEHIQRSSDLNRGPHESFDWLGLIGTGNLPALYGKLIDMIKDCNRTAGLSMLRWVTYAARPLHAHELLGALHAETGIELQDVNIKETCAGLLSVNEDGIVRLVHPTLREYLQARMRRSWNEISHEANEIITHACLKTLNSESLLESLGLFRTGAKSQESRVQPHSFEGYARQFWMFHYRLAENGSSFLPGHFHSSLELSLRNMQSSQKHESQLIEGHSVPLHLDPVNSGLLVGCRFGLLKLVKLELEMGANANLVSGNENISPLIWAVMFGHLNAVEILLQYGADSQLGSRCGSTPLMYAIANSRIEIVKLLVESGVQTLGEVSELFSLDTPITTPCEICGDVCTKYKLTPCTPNIDTNEAPTYPPIVIQSESVARAEMDLSAFTDPANTMPTRASIPIKWFAGAGMYRALAMAANSGIEDFKAILVAVGNDAKIFNHRSSMTRLGSEMRIC